MEKSDLPQTPPGATAQTSLSWLERVKARDAIAWERLVELYGPLVFYWCRRSGLDHEESCDVLQETFAAVASHLGQFRHESPGDTFRGWVRVIARNQIAACYRRKVLQPEAVGGTTANARLQAFPDEPPNHAETNAEEAGLLCHRSLELLRQEFGSRIWQAFWLTTVDQLPAGEVADRLQMTPGAVRQAKYKVLRRLRSELRDELD